MIPPVWHYTSAESALSIIRSDELRASRASEMNDPQEIIHAIAQVRRFALDEFPEHLSPSLRELIDEALTLPAPKVQQRQVFLVSACADAASEYLWREYAGPDGVAIKLATSSRVIAERKFVEPAPLTGWYPVAYTDDAQRSLVQKSADNLEFSMGLARKFPEHPIWSRFNHLSAAAMAAYLSPLVATFKEPKFEPEHEYRYVDRVGVGDIASINERTGRSYTRVKPTQGNLPIKDLAFGEGVPRYVRDELCDALQVAGHPQPTGRSGQ